MGGRSVMRKVQGSKRLSRRVAKVLWEVVGMSQRWTWGVMGEGHANGRDVLGR
jgi:hypothetical protein